MKILYLTTGRQLGFSLLNGLIRNDANIIGIAIPSRSFKTRVKSFSVKVLTHLFKIFRADSSISYKTLLNIKNHDVVKLACKYHIPIYEMDIKNPKFLALCRKIEPDIIVVGGWGQHVPEQILKLPKKGCINFHTSYLPKHRGGTPHIWAIASGEKETGITVHYMDENFDTGDIILQKKISILEKDTGETIFKRMCDVGPDLLVESIRLIDQGKVLRKVQDRDKASYDPVWKYEKHGLIDWNKSCKDVYNLIRACSSTTFLGFDTGAWTYHNGKLLKIWDVEYLPHIKSNSLPGTVLEITNNGFVVVCGNGAILVKTVQKAGKFRTRLPAAKYAKKSNLRFLGR